VSTGSFLAVSPPRGGARESTGRLKGNQPSGGGGGEKGRNQSPFGLVCRGEQTLAKTYPEGDNGKPEKKTPEERGVRHLKGAFFLPLLGMAWGGELRKKQRQGDVLGLEGGGVYAEKSEGTEGKGASQT